MRIGILAWDYEEFESRHLELVAGQMGYPTVLFTLDDVGCTETEGGFAVTVKGQSAEDLDVIISRAQIRRDTWHQDFEKLTLLSNLEGVCLIDPVLPFAACESKLAGMQRLSQVGVRVPPTVLCRSLEAIHHQWERYGQVIVKPSFGYGGTDVERVHADFAVSEPILQRLLRCYGELLVQPFVPHPRGDMRLTVIGNEVGFSFRRVPPPGGWKANVAKGAMVVPYDDPPEELQELAVRAARALGITIAGLDIIEYQGGYLMFEINNCPGWYPLAAADQIAVARKIITYAVSRAPVAHAAGSYGP